MPEKRNPPCVGCEKKCWLSEMRNRVMCSHGCEEGANMIDAPPHTCKNFKPVSITTV
jgi:hypothetical protein